jgi:tetratricopeptide (TPR) repeat protein
MSSSQESSIGSPLVSNSLKLVLLILLIKPLLGFGQQDTASKFDSLVRTAQQAQAANDYATAVNAYKQAVRMQPNMAELWANLGLMEEEAGDYSEATPSFQRANHLNPSLYVPNLFLGIDYVRAGKPKEAIPFLAKAERMNATDPQPRLALGRAYTALGNFSLAAHELTQVISLDPKQSSAWFALGIAYLDQMEEDSRKMSSEDQGSPYAKTLFAESLVKQSRYVEAARTFKSVIDIKPQPPCLHSELGWSLLRHGNASEAASEFKTERETNPQCGLAILGQARTALESGSNSEALKLLEELWNRDHGFVMANIGMLLDGVDSDRMSTFLNLLAQQRNAVPVNLYDSLSAAINGSAQDIVEDRAAHDSSKETTTDSHNANRENAASFYASGQFQRCANRLRSSLVTRQADSLVLLATCSFFTGDYERSSEASATLSAVSQGSVSALYWSIKANERLAFQSLAHFEQLEPNSAKSHILLGDIYRQRKIFDAALSEYKKALEIVPADPAAMLGMASAYLGNDDIGKTIETLQEALPHSPDDPELNLLMAEALVAHQDFAEAEPFLNKSLNAKPQMLPHVHALLGEVYANTGKTQEAIAQLKMGAESDNDGSLHYQLSRLYRQTGDSRHASEALEQMKMIQKQRHERAAIAAEDAHPASLDDGPQ